MVLKKPHSTSPVLFCVLVSLVAVVVLCPSLPLPAQQTRTEDFRQYTEYIEQCLAYSRQGKHDKVIQIAQEAIKLAPDEPRAYNYLCVSYAALGNYREAINTSQVYLNLLEARHALTIHAVARHADFLKRGKGKQEAIRFLESYRRTFPNSIDAYIEALEAAE
jgi:tetratricopeptide (TPR) repeat protein